MNQFNKIIAVAVLFVACNAQAATPAAVEAPNFARRAYTASTAQVSKAYKATKEAGEEAVKVIKNNPKKSAAIAAAIVVVAVVGYSICQNKKAKKQAEAAEQN